MAWARINLQLLQLCLLQRRVGKSYQQLDWNSAQICCSFNNCQSNLTGSEMLGFWWGAERMMLMHLMFLHVTLKLCIFCRFDSFHPLLHLNYWTLDVGRCVSDTPVSNAQVFSSCWATRETFPPSSPQVFFPWTSGRTGVAGDGCSTLPRAPIALQELMVLVLEFLSALKNSAGAKTIFWDILDAKD